ncbi:MAG: hypothetical protein LBQ34_04465 [Alphaproteobacteria bacterium]|jgi:hypothetical protein|nr:hypothetical protein [Alphaproteobacteria bacterium]
MRFLKYTLLFSITTFLFIAFFPYFGTDTQTGYLVNILLESFIYILMLIGFGFIYAKKESKKYLAFGGFFFININLYLPIHIFYEGVLLLLYGFGI